MMMWLGGFLGLFILAVLVVFCWLMREIGQTPTAEELKVYERLPYFRNGEFQSPEKIILDLDHVRNGPMKWTTFLSRSKYAPEELLPQIKLNRENFLGKPEDFALYWLGHSTMLMEIAGYRVMIDPVLENAGPLPFVVPRYQASPLSRDELPTIDYVVITHNHYDHLERKTIQSLKGSRFIVPLGLGTTLKGWGIDGERIIELGWGDCCEAGELRITAETAVHYSGRGLGDRNKTLWNSYIFQYQDKRIFWSGDSGYGAHFKRIGKTYGPFDLACVEIDGWNTGWPNTHMFPREAVTAVCDLRAQRMLPVHWAAYDLALHPWQESIDMVVSEAERIGVEMVTPRMGEKIEPGVTKSEQWWRTQRESIQQ